MCDGIQVGGNEQAAGVLTQAKTSILNFVVVDVSVKANNNCAHLSSRAQGLHLLSANAAG